MNPHKIQLTVSQMTMPVKRKVEKHCNKMLVQQVRGASCYHARTEVDVSEQPREDVIWYT